VGSDSDNKTDDNKTDDNKTTRQQDKRTRGQEDNKTHHGLAYLSCSTTTMHRRQRDRLLKVRAVKSLRS